MKIRDDANIAEAMKKMLDNCISSLIVEDGGTYGIITRRDIVNDIIAHSLDPKEAKVMDIMSQPLLTVSPDMSIKNVSRLMVKTNVRRFPVVDGDQLVGLISDGDILKAELSRIR